MALIECNECGKQISDGAATCPHCGCKTSFGVQHSQLKAQATRSIVDIGMMIVGGIVLLVGAIPLAENLDRLERWLERGEGVVGTFVKIAIGIGLVIGAWLDIKKQREAATYRESMRIYQMKMAEKSASPSSSSYQGDGWLCSCGRKNAPFVSSCVCGMQKSDCQNK